jgi:hypothetical protein
MLLLGGVIDAGKKLRRLMVTIASGFEEADKIAENVMI